MARHAARGQAQEAKPEAAAELMPEALPLSSQLPVNQH